MVRAYKNRLLMSGVIAVCCCQGCRDDSGGRATADRETVRYGPEHNSFRVLVEFSNGQILDGALDGNGEDVSPQLSQAIRAMKDGDTVCVKKGYRRGKAIAAGALYRVEIRNGQCIVYAVVVGEERWILRGNESMTEYSLGRLCARIAHDIGFFVAEAANTPPYVVGRDD